MELAKNSVAVLTEFNVALSTLLNERYNPESSEIIQIVPAILLKQVKNTPFLFIILFIQFYWISFRLSTHGKKRIETSLLFN